MEKNNFNTLNNQLVTLKVSAKQINNVAVSDGMTIAMSYNDCIFIFQITE